MHILFLSWSGCIKKMCQSYPKLVLDSQPGKCRMYAMTVSWVTLVPLARCVGSAAAVSLLFLPRRLVRGGAAAGRPEGLVPLGVCQGDHLQGHPGQEHGAHGAPAGAGNQCVALSSPHTLEAVPAAVGSSWDRGHQSHNPAAARWRLTIPSLLAFRELQTEPWLHQEHATAASWALFAAPPSLPPYALAPSGFEHLNLFSAAELCRGLGPLPHTQSWW